jgi:hypothetical protein
MLTLAHRLLRAIASWEVSRAAILDIRMNTERANRRTGIPPWAVLLTPLALVVAAVGRWCGSSNDAEEGAAR